MISSNTALGAECRYIALTVRGQQIQKAHAFVRTARKRLLYFERKQMKSIYNHTITCLLFIVIVCLWITWLPYHVVFHLGPDAVNWIASGRADRWQDNGTWMPIKRTMAMFVSVPELLDSIRAEFNGGNSIEAVLKYARQQVLVIDDLGAEKTSDWTFTTIYSVISKRVNYILPTIVTSNMSIEQIRQWEPRIASRLSGLKVIIMHGKDKRIKA